MRVLTTQMGLVRSTVAEPAMAPAIMDSAVVSFIEARPALRAAFSKKERVHSYPEMSVMLGLLYAIYDYIYG